MTTEMVKVADAAAVQNGALLAVTAGGRSALLTRVDGKVVAVANWCPHLGMPMTRGTIDAGVLRCPWHGSRFDVCSGRNLDWANAFIGVPMPGWTHKILAMGKAPAPLETLAVEERDGAIYISPPTKGRQRG